MRDEPTTRRVGRWLRFGGVFTVAAGLGAIALTAGALALDRDIHRAEIPTVADADTPPADTPPADNASMETAPADANQESSTETGPGSAQCRSLLDELIAREDDGRLTDEDFPEEVELDEAAFESMEVPSTPFDGTVSNGAAGDLVSFPDRVDITALAPQDLIIGVETCEEAGLLGDQEDRDEEDEGDEEDEFEDEDDEGFDDELDEDEEDDE